MVMQNETAKTSVGPMTGLRVVDLSINLLGPLATQILGDMGADVIKIETPDGDQMRWNGPTRTPGMGVFFMAVNRNKRSVVLDLKLPECREALMKLIATADVFVHSMRPSAAKKLGIDYEAIARCNPRIVYAFAPGFRADGPRSDEPAYDDVIQGISGLAALNKLPSGEPRYLPTVVADKFCGYTLASSIAMAMLHRERTGQGQELHVPMHETMLQFAYVEHLWGATLGQGAAGVGYNRVLSPHRRPYATKDGYMAVLAHSDVQWKRLLIAIGRPELAEDPRYTTMNERMRHIDELYGLVGELLRGGTNAEWREKLTAADIPFGPINSLGDLLEDPYLKETNYFIHYEHPSEGELMMTPFPVQFSASPATYRRPPPRLGQHTVEVLESIGLNEASLRAVTAKAPKAQA
jgi:crotonobetainyl-CoA:carnitine CoA-transferase CaiB-like acyl-CoA transferase